MHATWLLFSAAFVFLVQLSQGASHDDCFRAWEKVGCFADQKGEKNSLRALKKILITDRDPTMRSWSTIPIDWGNWGPYLHGLACRCAEMARAQHYKLFALQFYGECWVGPDDEKRYNMYGKSDKCFEKLKLPWEVCDDTNEEECMGHLHANYVYRLIDDPFAKK